MVVVVVMVVVMVVVVVVDVVVVVLVLVLLLVIVALCNPAPLTFWRRDEDGGHVPDWSAARSSRSTSANAR